MHLQFNSVELRQHYGTRTTTHCFEKQNLTVHVNILHKIAILVKSGHILWNKMFSGFHSDVLRLLCLNSVIHGGS